MLHGLYHIKTTEHSYNLWDLVSPDIMPTTKKRRWAKVNEQLYTEISILSDGYFRRNYYCHRYYIK
jgi:hypothetical protein